MSVGLRMKKIITIDGLASSGKSTLSRLLSKRLNWPWLSTGVLYRGMAFVGFKENFKEQDYLDFFESKDWRLELTPSKSLFFYKEVDISSKLYEEDIDDQASLFSAKASFRKALIPVQRAFYEPDSDKGLILEGRDCGTVLFPSAPLKIFLSAGENTRAKRRAKDRSQSKGSVLQAQKQRDERDKNRSFAPLIRPDNSLYLDSSKKSPEKLRDFVYKKVQKVFQLY